MNMRFFGEYWGFIFEFDSIKSFLLFTLGRICGIFIFLGMIDLFLLFIYCQGYGTEPLPILSICWGLFKLFFL